MHSDSVPLWRKIQRENFTSTHKLSDFLALNETQQELLHENKEFPLNLPRRLAEKIKKGCIDDPIFKQFVPLKEEKKKNLLFVKDPVGDNLSTLSSKCLKKYAGRVLLLTTGACAMNCRFCFRQNFSYAPLNQGFLEEIDLIKEDPTIEEVILSGGDPLSLSHQQLEALFQAVAEIPHVKRLRFHTRFPIGIPERIDEQFLTLLESSRLQIWFIIHCNHAAELDADVLASLKKIQKLGIPVLNQWVLLKGVNDTIEALQTLAETLVNQGIFPYYLHQLDRVEGTAHFEVSEAQGLQLISELQKRLSGYGVPKYVREIYGHPSKTPLL